MATPKLAKCGLYPNWKCGQKHDMPECTNCILVKHRTEPLYIWKNGFKLKRCPQCGKYKMLAEFKTSSKGHKSWCIECTKTNARNWYNTTKHTYSVCYKTNNTWKCTLLNSLPKAMKSAREMFENGQRIVQIKLIK